MSSERLTVELPSQLVAALREAVRSGAFISEGEALSTLLGWTPEHAQPEELEMTRAFVAEGIADAKAGRRSSAEDVYARVTARIEAVAAAKTT
jgi:Arc/MetJ-type ribon-helix-helix transcriptional regulator